MIGEVAHPFPYLRFVMRNGERVLQQQFSVKDYDEWQVFSIRYEWRDVPVTEEQP